MWATERHEVRRAVGLAWTSSVWPRDERRAGAPARVPGCRAVRAAWPRAGPAAPLLGGLKPLASTTPVSARRTTITPTTAGQVRGRAGP